MASGHSHDPARWLVGIVNEKFSAHDARLALGSAITVTLDDYLNAAVERGAFRSDRELGKALKLSHASITHMRTRRQWPSDDAMIRLANLAGIDASTALLDLNTWRAKSDDAKDHYRAILAKISAAILSVIVWGTTTEQVSASVAGQYTLCDKRRRSRLNRSTHKVRVADLCAVSGYRAIGRFPRAAA